MQTSSENYGNVFVLGKIEIFFKKLQPSFNNVDMNYT
jgi:hypothetical protein